MFNPRKKINVLHLTDHVVPGGGHKIILSQLAESSHQENINYTFVIMAGRIDENLRKELVLLNCKLYIFPKDQNKRRIPTLLRLLYIILKERTDIIHTHGPSTLKWSILCKSFIWRLKLVYSVHWKDNFIIQNKLTLMLHRLLVNANICISESVKQNTESQNIKKLVKIYNGVDINAFRSQNNFVENIGTECIKIINVARIEPKVKGQDILIKALNECRKRGINFKCSLVGGTYIHVEPRKKLEELIRKYELEQNIHFLEVRYDIPKLLEESDLFVLASRYEGFGLVIIEAMAAGLPIISSNVDGPAELIKDGENGLLFESENYLDLADKISYLYKNREEMKRLARNAFKSAEAYDISIMCKKYCELYRKVLED